MRGRQEGHSKGRRCYARNRVEKERENERDFKCHTVTLKREERIQEKKCRQPLEDKRKRQEGKRKDSHLVSRRNVDFQFLDIRTSDL